MSRYLVDKFLYRVDRDPAWLERYLRDARGCVRDWEGTEAHALGPETTGGHAFTSEEREALATRDYVRLYALGAHPFILWTLMIPALEGSFPNMRELQDGYASRVRPLGRPSFRT